MNNEFTKITKGKELIVRKRIANFLEKLLRHFEYDFDHDTYKKLIYAEATPSTPLEEMIKNYYDAYYYLLTNHKTALSRELIDKFFYILDGHKADQSMLIRIASGAFDYMDMPPMEAAVRFHLFAYKEMIGVEEIERTIVSLMLFNYMLLKFDSPTMQLLYQDLKNYESARCKYFDGDETPIFKLFYELMPKAKYQNRSYYKKLRPLTVNEIFDRLYQDKTMLENTFKIKKITIFGSFAKEIERIDSDIDLLVAFSHDLTHAQKQENIEYLSKYYFNVFNRYIDFSEISEYLDDELIKSTTVVKKLF